MHFNKCLMSNDVKNRIPDIEQNLFTSQTGLSTLMVNNVKCGFLSIQIIDSNNLMNKF